MTGIRDMTRLAAARNGTGPACLGAPDFTSAWLPKYGPAVPAGMAGHAIGAPLTLCGHHHDGAVRVMRDLVADRTDQQFAEAATAARPDDHEVGRARCLDQLRRREAADGPHRHRQP